jgi:hypothetical protein
MGLGPDHDVTVASTWLDNLTAPLRDGDYPGSGGLTVPPQAFTLPNWLAVDGPHNMLGVVCAYFNSGDTACGLKGLLAEPIWLFGK